MVLSVNRKFSILVFLPETPVRQQLWTRRRQGKHQTRGPGIPAATAGRGVEGMRWLRGTAQGTATGAVGRKSRQRVVRIGGVYAAATKPVSFLMLWRMDKILGQVVRCTCHKTGFMSVHKRVSLTHSFDHRRYKGIFLEGKGKIVN